MVKLRRNFQGRMQVVCKGYISQRFPGQPEMLVTSAVWCTDSKRNSMGYGVETPQPNSVIKWELEGLMEPLKVLWN